MNDTIEYKFSVEQVHIILDALRYYYRNELKGYDKSMEWERAFNLREDISWQAHLQEKIDMWEDEPIRKSNKKVTI
jgi:hypothetical protein